MSQTVKDIFISYSREEGVREFVKKLKVDLEANGVSVWLDVDDIPTGSDFHKEIGLALQSCRALIPVLTKRYVQSRYCKGELYLANSQKKVLLPVIYEDGWDEGEEGAGVSYIVATYNWANFRPNKDDHQESLDKLVQGAKLNLKMDDLPTNQAAVKAGGMVAAVKNIEKWQELGHQLNINPEMLSNLFKSSRSGAECRDEMIAYWEKHDNDASWEKLARALSRMGENQLTERIIKEHALSIEALTQKEEQTPLADNGSLTKPDSTDATDSEKTKLRDDYTEEDKQAMNENNLDEIKHHFALLKGNLRNALKLVGVEAADVSRYLKDLSIDFHSQVSDLEAIFDHLQSAQHWSYMNYGLVERLNKRFLEGNNRSIKQHILEYKGKFNGYLAMEKIISSEYFVEADDLGDDSATVVAKYGTKERHRLKVKLELGGRKLSDVSLMYIAELWESLQEEYELPSLTAQIDYIMEKCLEIVWLITAMEADKIRASMKSHIPFFQKHRITLVAIDDHAIYEMPDPEEQEQRSQQAILEKKHGDAQSEKGEYRLAVESYSKAMVLDPTSAIMPASKAAALFQQQLYADAEECCSLSLSLDENNAKAYLMRAKARSKLGKLELAIEDFQSTLKLEPGNREANVHSARLEGELRRRAKRAKQESPAKQGLSVPQQPIKKKCSLVTSEATSDVCEIPRQRSELEVAQTLDELEISLRILLGEKVLVTSSLSSEVPVSVFEQEGSVVGLFFSGIWCPPSKEFTPELVDWYNRFKKGPKGHLLNIVFISSDEDDESWREYCADMPWHALDFKDRDKESKLASRFKVDAIPTLIFVDGSTGKLISKEGRSIISEDPRGEQFPWKPKPFHDIVADAKFIDQDRKETVWNQLQGKIIGLFFSAHWCPPGQQLTPTLVATYHKLKETRQDFEFIYVSSDREEEEWKASLASMPWISFHHGDERTETIRKSFHIDSIPSLILLDDKGHIITTEGLTYIFNDQDGETFPWYVNALTEYTIEDINDTAYLIWFVPNASVSRAKEVLEPLAKEYISKKSQENMEVKLMFFIAGEENETVVSVRRKARLPTRDPLLTIVDVPGNQVHMSDHSEITEENAKKFVYDYLTRRLMGRRLR